MKSKYTDTYFWKTRDDFDSDEELEFYCWLKEAEEKKLLGCIEYQCKEYKLSPRVAVAYSKKLKTKTKIAEKFLFRQHKYTLDFRFWLTCDTLKSTFINSDYLHTKIILVDVKGSFNKFGDPKQFALNQKWVYDKFDTYIEKIVPEKLFKKTWVPEIARLSPKIKKPVKKYIGVKTINEFMADC